MLLVGLSAGIVGGTAYGIYEEVNDDTPGIDANVVANYAVDTGLVLAGVSGVVAAAIILWCPQYILPIARILGGTTAVAQRTLNSTDPNKVQQVSNALQPTINPLLQTAQQIGGIPIERVSTGSKLAAQIMKKTEILFGKGVTIVGNPESLTNPQVQSAVAKMNNISMNPDRIWVGTYKSQKVFEYIQGNIGVIRDQGTGALESIFLRDATGIAKLQSYVNNGTASWLK
jgi:hypothetical protein